MITRILRLNEYNYSLHIVFSLSLSHKHSLSQTLSLSFTHTNTLSHTLSLLHSFTLFMIEEVYLLHFVLAQDKPMKHLLAGIYHFTLSFICTLD